MIHLLVILGIVWVATAGCVFGLGFEAHRWWAERPERHAIPYRLTLDGYRAAADYRTAGPFQGAADHTQFEIPRPAPQPQIDRLALLSDAIGVAESQMDAAEAHREAEQIWLEVEMNPDLWRHRP
jgi:hypothetical protein